MGKFIVTVFILCFTYNTPGFTQDKCGTVKECAQAMVKLANELKEENEALLAKIQEMEEELETHKRENANALSQRMEQLKTGKDSIPSGGNFTTKLCPQGSYMVGAKGQVDPGGRAGQVSSFSPICRTMP